MRNTTWRFAVAGLLAGGLALERLPAEADAVPGADSEAQAEVTSLALRGQAAVTLRNGRTPEVLARFAPGADAGIQRSASAGVVVHGVLGRTFAYTPLALPRPPAPEHVDLRSAPNPSRASVDIAFDLPRAGPIDLRIYDLAGREVRRLFDGQWFEAGRYAEPWDGRQRDGALAPAGVYFARLRTVAGESRKRLVRL